MRLNPLLQQFKKRLKSFFSPPPQDPGNPDDPYALVGAPVKPRPLVGTASAAAVPERYDFN